MERPSNFKKIREAIKLNKNFVDTHISQESEKYWGIKDSILNNFGKTFMTSLPKEVFVGYPKHISPVSEEFGEIFKKYIERTLNANKKHNLTAIEFGGPGSNLFDGFSKKFFKKTIGVCLSDVRDGGQAFKDKINNHIVLPGDILEVTDDKLFTEVRSVLNTEKTDLIISRMMGPLHAIRKHPAILNKIADNWFNLLEDNGLMFIQFEYLNEHNPESLEVEYDDSHIYQEHIRLLKIEESIKQWIEKMKKDYPETEIQLGRGVLRLHKKPISPKVLS